MSEANVPKAAGGNILTRSKPFRLLVKHAFTVVDANGTGEVGKAELYAGLLLVHLKLAKHAGPAACYTCDQLFEAADSDRSGGIDRTEFSNIVGALCAQILSRIFVYYAVLIFLVPRLAARAVDVARIPNGSYLEMAAEQAISVGLFFAVIPVIWDLIDSRTERRIASKSASSASLSASCTPATEGGPSKAGDDKKDD